MTRLHFVLFLLLGIHVGGVLSQCTPNQMECLQGSTWRHCGAGGVWLTKSCPGTTVCKMVDSLVVCDHPTGDSSSSSSSVNSATATLSRTSTSSSRTTSSTLVSSTISRPVSTFTVSSSTGPSTGSCLAETRTVTVTRTVTLSSSVSNGPTSTPSFSRTTSSSSSPSSSASGSASSGTCTASGFLVGRAGPSSGQNGAESCVEGQRYDTYTCSPQVSARTSAILTVNGFGSGEDGGGASYCDNQFHSNSEMICALSTGWLLNNGNSRCNKNIRISANGRTAVAKIVDMCDSRNGCAATWDYQPPCRPDVVDCSAAVWTALGVSSSSPTFGWMSVTWTDA